MSRCRCLGHVYTEKYKIIIIKILYSVKIAPCKGMRISKSEKLWLVVFGIWALESGILPGSGF